MNHVSAGITVLAVDDDKAFTEVISRYLTEDSSYTVLTAESGKEALNILNTQQVSAVIADYQMPELDGLDLLRILRGEGNDIPFIIFTGQGCESVAIEALNEGADFYLVKGEDPGPQFLALRKNLNKIVAKKQADEALILSETENRRILSLLRATLDATEDGILVETTQGDIAWYNERLLQLLNLNTDQVIGRKWNDVISTLSSQLEELPNFLETEGRENSIGTDQTYKLLTFKDGRVIEIHARPQICEGIFVGRVWSYHDLTDRVKAEQALHESRERFRILFDNSPISHMALAEDGSILEVNQTFLAMLGYIRDEIIGRIFTDLCDPSFRNTFNAFFINIKSGIPVDSHELMLFHRDETERIVIADGLAVKSHDGSILQVQFALRDITRQRKVEEQLVWTESILEEVVELLPFGICVTDGDEKKIIFENTRFNEIWNRDISFKQKNCDITLDNVMRMSRAEIQTADLPGEEQNGLIPGVSSSEILLPGKRILRSYQRRFPNKTSDNRTLWAFEDISLFKKQEEEIRQYARRLEILSKIISLSNRATKVQSLCEFTLQSIVPLMSFDGGIIYLLNQDSRIATYVSSVGMSEDMVKDAQMIESSEFTDILTNGSSFISDNLSDICPDLAHKYSIESVVIIPLPGGGNILGAICLFNRRKFLPNNGEKEILIGVGKEIGGALVRLQDQESLRNARRNLDNLVNSISDMVFVIDADSNTILEVNEEVLRHLGYCREDLIGRSVQTPLVMGILLFPPDLFSRDSIVREHTMPTVEGNLIHVETSTAPGTWNVRKAIFCVTRDISESLMVKELVRQSEERLRALFESSPIGIELYDGKGDLIDLNSTVQDILGVPDRRSLIGHSLFSIPHIRTDFLDDVHKGRTVTYEQVLDFTERDQSQVYHSDKHELIKIRVIITPLRMNSSGDNSGTLVLIENITAEKEAEEKLKKYTQVLQMTVDALGCANRKLNLLSDVTRHDILNQIHVILNYLDLAKIEVDPHSCTRHLQIIEDAVGLIERQIQFTRSYQDLGVNTPEWQCLTDIVENLSGSDVQITSRTNGYIILGDPLLPKVFENLLDNSIRHGGGVTRVDIATSESDDGDIIITWSDDGKGISEFEKKKIFEKGYGKNTGFGLFLIREILAITRIQITEIGKEGEGACFKIRVPQGNYRTKP